MTNNMTEGKPFRIIISFMIPMCLGNIFQQFYNIADSIIAGRFIGVDALAAIGSTSSLIFLVTGWLNGMTSGFAIMVAQSFGAQKYDRMRHFVAMSIYLCLAFVVVMTVGLEFANIPILRLMNSPEELMGDISSYMAIIYAGLIATAAYNALAAVLRALGDSKTPLYFLIFSAVVNVILDIVFVTVIKTGVKGCGYATVIAQGLSAVLCLVYIAKRFEILHLSGKDFKLSWNSMGKLLGLGIPMGLQFSITAIGTIIVQGAVNVFGAVYMAAFSAAGKVQNIMVTVMVSFGATIATYVGQNRGAGKMDRVHAGVRITLGMELVWSVLMILIMLFAGPLFLQMFVDGSQQDVLEIAMSYFKMVAWCYPFLSCIFLYRNALQGMGYGLVPMLGGIFELLARGLVILLVSGRGSFALVCLSDPCAWIAALIPLVPYYYFVMHKYKKQHA